MVRAGASRRESGLSPRHFLPLGLTVLAVLSASVASARDRSPSEILASPDLYDGRALVIAGTIGNPRELLSKRGNPYYVFELEDGRRAIRVVSFGNTLCKAGAYATVEGRFRKVKRQGQETVYNEVEAYRVTCR